MDLQKYNIDVISNKVFIILGPFLRNINVNRLIIVIT